MKKPALSSSPPLHQTLALKDEREIYGSDPNDYYAVQYRQRIRRIVETARKAEPVRVAEFGCAQGNISLLLAESGLNVIALDISPIMLSYCRLKYERGRLSTIAAAAGHPPLKPGTCDCVILGEIIEHCSDPLSMLVPAYNLLRRNGIIIITTPNQESSNNTLPSYEAFKVNNPGLESDCFGADGDAHVFAFTQRELAGYVSRAGFTGVRCSWTGNHFLQWKPLYHLRHAAPWFWTNVLEALVPHVPVLNKKAANCLFCTARKDSNG
jgi:SAM-dependent methyltransferase